MFISTSLVAMAGVSFDTMVYISHAMNFVQYCAYVCSPSPLTLSLSPLSLPPSPPSLSLSLSLSLPPSLLPSPPLSPSHSHTHTHTYTHQLIGISKPLEVSWWSDEVSHLTYSICSVLPKQNLRHDSIGILLVEAVTTSNLSFWNLPIHTSKEILYWVKACWADMPYVCWGEH